MNIFKLLLMENKKNLKREKKMWIGITLLIRKYAVETKVYFLNQNLST